MATLITLDQEAAVDTAPHGCAAFRDVGGDRMLEADFPFAELSSLARSDHVLSDPVYGAHKWWARRPRAVIRALILAAHLPAATSKEQFWSLFGEDHPTLAGCHVGDPFTGGGTTLVEGARLGASVSGTDVDPLAVRIARDELAIVDNDAVSEAGNALLDHLRGDLGELYPSHTGEDSPLHYFRLRRAACPQCEEEALVYRSPVLARDQGRAGAVVRDGRQMAFCPECRALHRVGAKAGSFVCCHRRWSLAEGTFSGGRFVCPACSSPSSLLELKAGVLPEELIAVEVTYPTRHRELLPPDSVDEAALARAGEIRGSIADLPSDSLEGIDGGRPHSYGFETIEDLFGDRQLVVLASAFRWLRSGQLEPAVRARVELAVSNAVSSNNRICGYATDYGRLAPAFTGVRSYSLPILAVELNPLHPSAGRGTLEATLRRLVRSSPTSVRRRVRTGPRIDTKDLVARRDVAGVVSCGSAEDFDYGTLGRFSAVVTDPPYYNFIAYSDLSLLHRSWLGAGASAELGGVPIFPSGDKGREEFTRRLGSAFKAAGESLQTDALFVFTFHSAHAEAWEALGDAVGRANLLVTALFPVWADARSSASHGHPGSCEWDLVWVCRTEGIEGRPLPESPDAWIEGLPAEIGGPDRLSMELGLAAARRVNHMFRGGRVD
jgi:adenine-specific DNA methylase